LKTPRPNEFDDDEIVRAYTSAEEIVRMLTLAMLPARDTIGPRSSVSNPCCCCSPLSSVVRAFSIGAEQRKKEVKMSTAQHASALM